MPQNRPWILHAVQLCENGKWYGRAWGKPSRAKALHDGDKLMLEENVLSWKVSIQEPGYTPDPDLVPPHEQGVVTFSAEQPVLKLDRVTV